MRVVVLAALLVACVAGLHAQAPRGTPTPAKTPKEAAPIDLTGYFVSIVTEDWRWRMVTPAKGDYASVPITPEAKKVADTWDPTKDEAAGEQCRSYGAAAIMRVPGRVHVTWQDAHTLKVETDAGMQTRLLHFGSWKPAHGKPAWQGDSVAEWEQQHLKVVTTRMRPGYLRKNGVPYSANAVLTEYWDLFKERTGEEWLVITTHVDDPKYLQAQFVTSPNFKKEPDGSKWDPVPCSAKW